MVKSYPWLLVASAIAVALLFPACETDDGSYLAGVVLSDGGDTEMLVAVDSVGETPLFVSKRLDGVLVVDVSVVKVEVAISSPHTVVSATVDGGRAELRGNTFEVAVLLDGGAQLVKIDARLSDGSELSYELQIVSPDELTTFGFHVVLPDSAVAGQAFDVECLSILDEGVAQDIGLDSHVSFSNPEVVRDLGNGSYIVQTAGELGVACHSEQRDDTGEASIMINASGAISTLATAAGETSIRSVAGASLDVDCLGKDRFGNAEAASGGLGVTPNISGAFGVDGSSVYFARAGTYEVRCAPLGPGGRTRPLVVVVEPDPSTAALSVFGIGVDETLRVGDVVSVDLLMFDAHQNYLGDAAIDGLEIEQLIDDSWIPQGEGSFESDGDGGARYVPEREGRYRARFVGTPMGSGFDIGLPPIEIEWDVESLGRELVRDGAWPVEYGEEGRARTPVCVSPTHGRMLSRNTEDDRANAREFVGPVLNYYHELWNVGRITEVVVRNNTEAVDTRSFSVCDQRGVCLGRDTDVLNCGDLAAAESENVEGRFCSVQGWVPTLDGLNVLEVEYEHEDYMSGETRWSTLVCSNSSARHWQDATPGREGSLGTEQAATVSESRLYQSALDAPPGTAVWDASQLLWSYINSDETTDELNAAIRRSYPGFERFFWWGDSEVEISLVGETAGQVGGSVRDELVVELNTVWIQFGGGIQEGDHCYDALLPRLRITYQTEFWSGPDAEPRVTLVPPREDLNNGEGFETDYTFSGDWTRRRSVVCKRVGRESKRNSAVDQQVRRIARRLHAQLSAELQAVSWSDVLSRPETSSYRVPSGAAFSLEGPVAESLRRRTLGGNSDAAAGLLRHWTRPAGLVHSTPEDGLLAYRGARWGQGYGLEQWQRVMRDREDPVLRRDLNGPRSLLERETLVPGLPVVNHREASDWPGQFLISQELRQHNSVLDGVWRLGAFHEAELPLERGLVYLVEDPFLTLMDVTISLENPPRFVVNDYGNVELEVNAAFVRITPHAVRSGELREALERFGPIELVLSMRVAVDASTTTNGGWLARFVPALGGATEVSVLGTNDWSSLELLTDELGDQFSTERHAGEVEALQAWLSNYIVGGLLEYASDSTGVIAPRDLRFRATVGSTVIDTSESEASHIVESGHSGASLSSRFTSGRP